MRSICNLRIIAMSACLLATGLLAPANGAQLGTMKADKILFLGNSITLTLPNNWGASASEQSKDYVHLLAGKIDTQTGERLELISMDKTLVDGEQQPGTANIINVAHIFERNYRTYTAAKLQYQIDKKPNIVVLEFGENIPMDTFDAVAFKNSLRALVTDLKNSSNPEMFFTSLILGSNATVDAIKREIIAEDPTHRVFVDMSDVMRHGENCGDYGHPSDAGMAVIADKLFGAMVTHSVPEPTSLVLSSAALVAMVWHAWSKRKSST